MLIASDGSHPPNFTRSPIKFVSPLCYRPVLPYTDRLEGGGEGRRVGGWGGWLRGKTGWRCWWRGCSNVLKQVSVSEIIA